MKTNEFSNVLKSMKTMFPDDNRPVDVFIQEYYPALKGFDFQVVVKAINSLAARMTNFQKTIWPLNVIEDEVRKNVAGKHYPVVKWRKKATDGWKTDTMDFEKAKKVEKQTPKDLFYILYDTLPDELKSKYNDPNDPVASSETVKTNMTEITKIIENATGPLAKVIKKEIITPTKEEKRYVKHEVDI
jgi:hypothetical protein